MLFCKRGRLPFVINVYLLTYLIRPSLILLGSTLTFRRCGGVISRFMIFVVLMCNSLHVTVYKLQILHLHFFKINFYDRFHCTTDNTSDVSGDQPVLR